MSDNNTFQRNNIGQKPIIQLPPAVTDIVFKTLKKISLPNVHVDNSVYFGIDLQKENEYVMYRCDLTSQIGEGVQFHCCIEPEAFKIMNSFKGNFNLNIFDNDENNYTISNGDFSCEIEKIPFQDIKKFLPNLTKAVRLKTHKCKHFKNAIGKVKYIDILIINNRINSIQPSKPKVIMSFDPLSTTEVLSGKADLVLRSYHFFRLIADEVELLITFEDGNFWLCTRVNFIQDIVIEQFEALKIVE